MPKQFAGSRSCVHRLTLILTLATLPFFTGCALRNPFASDTVKPQAVAATSGVVQKTEQEKLFGLLPVYRPDVQQGNFVSKEMVAQLREGMTREQVRFIMGTPLLSDIFHANRWDFPFRMKKGNGELTSSHVVVLFENDRVARFEGGDLPSEQDYLLRIAAPKK
jgi:outer membrane protein assembly factor BamE